MTAPSIPITEEYLRELGFKWDTVGNDPVNHWLLWLGESLGSHHSHDDLGIELAAYRDAWHCWIRADYCGRYTRIIHVRMLQTAGELCALIEAMIGQRFDVSRVWYGSLRTAATDQWMRTQAKTVHVQAARDWGRRVELDEGLDPSQIGKLAP